MNGKCSDAIRYLGRQASRTHNYFLRLRGSFFFFLQRYILRILRYKLWLLFYCFGASGLVCYFLKIFHAAYPKWLQNSQNRAQGSYFFFNVTSEKSEFIFNCHQIHCQA